MVKVRKVKPMFSLSPVLYRDSPIEGRGVFARRQFQPGDVIVPYAPRQRRLDVHDPEAAAAAETKLTLLSDGCWVIVPDQSVPGGWLCNHSCDPNASLYSSGAGRIECLRPISRGEEVTIFYGWVTRNRPRRDPCRCGSARCLGFINFDLSDEDAAHQDRDTPEGRGFRARLAEYAHHLHAIDQDQVLDTIARTLDLMLARRTR